MTPPNPTPDAGRDEFVFVRPLEEKPIWADLYENLRDVFFKPTLPPLELTSTPVPVPDRMAVKTNPWAFGTSTVVNGGLALNEQVVTSNQYRLQPGAHVRVNAANASTRPAHASSEAS